MAFRYRAAFALTSILLFAAPHAAAARRPAAHHALQPASLELYSRRALRRARTILQLKLLELKLERLERVRRAIERQSATFQAWTGRLP